MPKLIIPFLLLIPICLFGQESLSLPEAIEIALEKNYGIQVARLEQQAVDAQVYKANAGMGPFVNWDAGFIAEGNNVNQNFLDGRIVSRFGRSWAPNTSINLGWSLYDGGRMQATYEKLGELSQYSRLEGKLLLQNTITQVMEAYYEVVKQKERVIFLNTIIKYYEERLQITEERWQVGRGSKLDFIQSKTDLNTQLADYAAAKNEHKNAKVLLNQLLNRSPEEEFTVIVEPIPDQDYDYNELLTRAKNQNKELLLVQKAMDISLITEKETEAAKRPSVDFLSALSYSYNNTNAGFILSNRRVALNAGFSARWNLYNGNHTRKQIEISKINTAIISKQQEQLLHQITSELNAAFNQFILDKELLELAQENKILAEENLSISLEKFKLGASTILELNEAQRRFDTSLNRLVNAQYNVKISELDLLILSGSLVN
mgnify:CR=1 FL=1